MIKLRSEFDRKAADVFRAAQKRGISVRDFKDTDEYKAAVKEYDDGIQTVRDSIINFQPAASGAPAGGRPAGDRSNTIIQPGSAGPRTVWRREGTTWVDTKQAAK
jgi:hypothetical protein